MNKFNAFFSYIIPTLIFVIGIYCDDPSWWENLKQKHNANDREIKSENKRQASPIYDFSLSTDMKTKLIKKVNAARTFDEESNVLDLNDIKKTVKEECNMIGESPLHIAIMYDDLKILKLIIEEKGYDVNQRNLEGTKFTSGFNSKETTNLIDQSKYGNLAYFGEYPLAFAACFANKEIYDYLVDKGADPNLQGILLKKLKHLLIYRKTPLLVPGVDPFSYASIYVLDRLIAEAKTDLESKTYPL